MLREIRRSAPREPTYPIVTARVPVELPLHIHVPRLQRGVAEFRIDGCRSETAGQRCVDCGGEGYRSGCGQRRRERRIARGIPHRGRARLVHCPRVGATENGTAILRDRPRQAQPWFEVPVVLLVNALRVDADAHQRDLGCVEDHEPVVPFSRGDVPFVAHPELEGEVGPDGDLVLKERRRGPLIDDAAALPQRNLNAFAVPARNPATLGKLNTPAPSAKFSLMKCRYSPPIFIACRPLHRLTASANT